MISGGRGAPEAAASAYAPSVFWFVGGTDPDRYAKAKEAGRLNAIPTNHNPRFAPVIHPTLQTGVETLIIAARAWLAVGPATRPIGPVQEWSGLSLDLGWESPGWKRSCWCSTSSGPLSLH